MAVINKTEIIQNWVEGKDDTNNRPKKGEHGGLKWKTTNMSSHRVSRLSGTSPIELSEVILYGPR